ncbi:hypothetical protein AWZ03_009423 [Drosophila navojoa]|uniref:Uncharacterized protein n=1 Tax=Drosophila navojoa TaxID=7232 RepID=A0A484B5M9_DRONA|nr:hypothetical protein AWZ03_009423 [Drosophila navojoa]
MPDPNVIQQVSASTALAVKHLLQLPRVSLAKLLRIRPGDVNYVAQPSPLKCGSPVAQQQQQQQQQLSLLYGPQ